MKEYKRLTKRSDFGWFHRNCGNCPNDGKCNPKGSNFFDCLEVFVDRLGELEDKIEQGLLLELDKPFIRPVGKGILADSYIICKAKLGIVSDCLTKEEAEAKLAELRGVK